MSNPYKHLRWRALAGSLLIFFMMPPAKASDFHSPRTAALGGAGHAHPILNDAIYLNPSFVSFLPSYSISANYLWFRGPKESDAQEVAPYHGHNWNFSIQDGRSELFQAGAGLSFMEDSTKVHVGASKAIVKRWGVGIGGKYIRPKSDSRKNTLKDATFSTTGLINDSIYAALIIDNLLESTYGKELGYHREITLGSKFNLEKIMIFYLDPLWVPNLEGGRYGKYGYEAGVELTPFSDMFLRFGMFRNAKLPFTGGMRSRGFGFGIGWIAPRVSLDFGISRSLEPIQATAQEVGMTVYF